MALTKKTDRTIPVSLHGSLYTSVGIFLFTAGIIRGELVSSICGCALLLYSLFCLVCTVIGYFRWKSVKPILSWRDKNQVTLTVHEDINRLFGSNSFFIESFYNVKYAILPETKYTDAFFLKLPIDGLSSDGTVALPPRGHYTPVAASTIIQDYSDFFHLSIVHRKSDFPESFYVYPAPEKPAISISLTERSTVSHGKSTFRRSEELYEIRQYVPGDDPRKINWKLYAHTGALMLREGELLPPPSSEYVFLFNTSIQEAHAKRTEIKNHFDMLINRAAWYAISLSSQKKIVSIQESYPDSTSGLRTINPDDPESVIKIKESLSSVQPGQPWFPEKSFLAPDFQHALIFYFVMPENNDWGFTAAPVKNMVIFAGPWTGGAAYREKLDSLYKKLAERGFHVEKI